MKRFSLKNFQKHNQFNFFTKPIKQFCQIPKKMRAVMQTGPGGYETLFIGETSLPILRDDEVLMKVEAFALNRADIAQREGLFPPTKGSSSVLGLECSGYLVENSKTNKDLKVMALVFGGAYAEYVAVKKDNVIVVPENLDVAQAAAIPEAWITSFQLCKLANIREGDHVLIHAAASGVGTALIQLVRLFEAESICIVSNDQKVTYCVHLGQGTAFGLLRKDTSKLNKILNHTKHQGCSVILDCVGAQEFNQNINYAAMDCRWVCYGFLGGSKIGEFDLMKFMNKRISLHFSTLRNRSMDYKTDLLNDFAQEIMPKFGTGELVPIIDTVFTSVDQIRDAHKKMESDINIGKIVVKWN